MTREDKEKLKANIIAAGACIGMVGIYMLGVKKGMQVGTDNHVHLIDQWLHDMSKEGVVKFYEPLTGVEAKTTEQAAYIMKLFNETHGYV